MDISTAEEDYYSEFDIDDSEEFTAERRKNKDAIEIQLREIDALENKEIEGDTIIVEQFTNFMRNLLLFALILLTKFHPDGKGP